MEKPIKPKMISVAKLLEISWADYVVKFKGFMGLYWESAKKLAAVAFILAVLLGFSLLAGYLPESTGNVFRVAILLLALLITIGGFIYLTIRIQIATTLACAQNPVDSGKVFRQSKKFFWKFLGLAFLTAIITFLWSCLLIIPGIIFSFICMFAPYALLFEGYEGWSALKRSRELIKGYWWQAVWRVLALSILWSGLSLPSAFFGDSYAAMGVYTSILMIAGFLIAPLFMIYYYKIYENLKTIKGESKIAKKADISVK